MSSAFSPEAFLDATVTAPSVRRPPLRPGDYNAVIGEPKVRPWQSKDDPTKSGFAVDLPIEVEVPADQLSSIGQPKINLRDSIMLDLTAEGLIDNSPGKNRKMRQYREATDLNKPGDQFNFRMLQGRTIKVKVGHETYQGDLMDRVDGVARS